MHFRYRYTTPAELAAAAAKGASRGGATDAGAVVVGAADVWRRERIGEYMPAIGADDPQVMNFLRAHGWN